MRKYIPFLIVWLVLILTPLVAAQPGVFAVMPISRDPYTNPDAQHQTQASLDNAAYGNTVVAAFESGLYPAGVGSSNIGWATSTDGGNTYSIGFLPGTTPYSTPPGPWGRVWQPAVAYDVRHDVWLIVSDTKSPAAFIVSRSTSGGITWDHPIVIFLGGGSTDGTYGEIGCDNTPSSPYYGQCYSVRAAAFWDSLSIRTSTDGGQTWGPLVAAPIGAVSPKIVVQPNGTVIIVSLQANLDGPWFFKSVVSQDGGQSWSDPQRMFLPQVVSPAVLDLSGSHGNLVIPSVAVDAGGKVYVASVDCRFHRYCSLQANDIVLTTSTNGLDWSRLKRIPIGRAGSSTTYFLPGLAVTGSGNTARLALTYYYYPDAICDLSNCQLDVGFVSSVNGGLTWSTPQTLAGPMDLNWLPHDEYDRKIVTHYISTTFVGDTAISTFAAAEPPIGDTFQLAAWGAINPVLATGNYPLPLQAELARGDSPR